MAGSTRMTALSIVGMLMLLAGAILGVVAMSSSKWVKTTGGVVEEVIPGSNTMEDMPCDVGIFSYGCTRDNGEYELWGRSEGIMDTTWLNAVRACYIVAVVLILASVIFIIVTFCKEFGARTNCVRQLNAMFFSLGTCLHLLSVMVYVMSEYKADPGFFAATAGPAAFNWALYVGAVGALLCPIGVFLTCTQQHFTENKEAGVAADYDEKTNQDTYI